MLWVPLEFSRFKAAWWAVDQSVPGEPIGEERCCPRVAQRAVVGNVGEEVEGYGDCVPRRGLLRWERWEEAGKKEGEDQYT